MDDENGDDDRDELTSEWGGESRHDWRGWRNESGRKGDNRWGVGTACIFNACGKHNMACTGGCFPFFLDRELNVIGASFHPQGCLYKQSGWYFQATAE